VDFLGGRIFKACAHHELLLQAVVLGLATMISMFVNDTTVVLVLLPTIMALCKENNLSPSRYLLCVAYGSLLGGQWTLIGTRSNIVISDYLNHRTGTGLGFFDFTAVAAVVFAACAAYFLVLGRRLLPKTNTFRLNEQGLATRYLTEVTVTAQSRAVGRILDAWAWGRRSDVSVLEVIRGQERIPSYGQFRLQPGDVLVLAGQPPP
jgi:di/tricarboxylate transporter